MDNWTAPSRKWWAATVVGLGALGTTWAEAGHWSSALTVMAIGMGAQRATAYLVPNAPDSASEPRGAVARQRKTKGGK